MTFKIITPPEVDQHKSTGFITVYKPIAGWKAVQYWWNPEMGGFWEPWQTGEFAWPTPERALQDARLWAEAEDVPYLPPLNLVS